MGYVYRASHDPVIRTTIFLFSLYPLNFVLTYSGIIILYLNKKALWHPGPFLTMSLVCESSSGVMNVFVYWVGYRRIMRTALRLERPSPTLDIGLDIPGF